MITEEHYQELDKLLKACVDNEEHLSDWENNFVNEWCDKLDTYGTSVRISDKQQVIFDRMEEKLSKKGCL
jgi:DNA phosphorothioation-dependent restriction protein DptG